jgi:hypothetical protein
MDAAAADASWAKQTGMTGLRIGAEGQLVRINPGDKEDSNMATWVWILLVVLLVLVLFGGIGYGRRGA